MGTHMKHDAVVRTGVLAIALALLAMPGASAQSSDIEALKREVAALRQQIAALDALLRQHLPSAPSGPDTRTASPALGVEVPIDGAPRKGSEQARVAIVEFSDYHCPFCSSFARTTFAEIEKRYVSTGKIQYVFMDFPIASLHPDALPAHRAAACAGEQGRFWEMHGQLFGEGPAKGATAIGTRAQRAALDGRKFEECLSSDRHGAAVRARIALGQKLGVRGTPTFLVGQIDGSGFTAKRVITGAQPFEAFESAIESVLAAPRP